MSRGHLINEHDNVDVRVSYKDREIRIQSKAKGTLPKWLSMEAVDMVVITVDGAGNKPAQRYALVDFDLIIKSIKHDLL